MSKFIEEVKFPCGLEIFLSGEGIGMEWEFEIKECPLHGKNCFKEVKE